MAGRFPTVRVTLPGPNTPRWFMIKNATAETGFPADVRDMLFSQLRNDHLAAVDFVATLTCALMVEAGFVPVTNALPLIPADELVNLDDAQRCTKCYAMLKEELKRLHSLRRVSFRAVKRAPCAEPANNESQPESSEAAKSNDQPEAGTGTGTNEAPASNQSPQPGPSNASDADPVPDLDRALSSLSIAATDAFVYGNELVELSVAAHNEVLLILRSGSFSHSYRLREREYLRGLQGREPGIMSYTPRAFFLEGKFDASQFAHLLKTNMIYCMVDDLETYCTEVRGFDSLPAEVIFHIGKYLDMKSFNNFVATSKRNNTVLDNDDGWKLMLSRIQIDFPRYGLRVANESPLPPNSPGLGSKELYKNLYLRARARAALRNRSFYHYPYRLYRPRR